MEKKIVITVNKSDEGTRHSIVTEGEISLFEILGILHYYEKKVGLDILSGSKLVTPATPSTTPDTELDHEG